MFIFILSLPILVMTHRLWKFLDQAPAMAEDSMIEVMHMAKEFNLSDLSR